MPVYTSTHVQVSSISGSDTDSDDEPSTGRAATQKSSQLMFKSQGIVLLLGGTSAPDAGHYFLPDRCCVICKHNVHTTHEAQRRL